MPWKSTIILSLLVIQTFAADSDYNVVNTDGSFDFRYDNPDSFHESHGTRNNVVQGAFGGRNPGTGAIDRTEYTAGPRGFRPKGKNVHRKYNLSQRPVGPIGNKDDPYFDPYEDPSYNFQFNTRSYSRKEGANRLGDVKGSYTYLDDVGDRHDVEYIAGKNTGFHVKTPYPDSNPNSYRTTYFRDPRKPYLRGRSFVQRGLDGSYRFAAIGPDQRRTETSDAVGNVRGSYTYRDEKGVQHAVHYIAGPNIGYRVLKNVKGPHLPTLFPFNSPEIVPPDFYDNKEGDSDVFTEAETSYVTPTPNRDNDNYYPDNTNQVDVNQSTNRPAGETQSTGSPPLGFSSDDDEEQFDDLFSTKPSGKPNTKPSGRPSGTGRPTSERPTSGRPSSGRPSSGRPSSGRPSSGRPSFVRPSIGGPSTTPRPSDELEFTGISIEGGPTTFPSTTSRPTTVSSEFGGGFSRPGSTQTSVSITRPSFTGRPRPINRPPSSFGSSKPRPTADFGEPLDEIDEDDIFGSSRPSSSPPSISRPPATGSTLGRPQPTTSNRPSSTGFPRPSPTTSTFPRPSTTTSLGRPQDTKPVLQFDVSEVEKGKFHTLVTNLGDTLFTVPPGVSVRAHVQNIDLVPLYARSPSPSEQYNAEVEDDEVQINAESSNGHISVISTGSTQAYTSTTTMIPQPTTATTNAEFDSTEENDDSDDDDGDVDIF